MQGRATLPRNAGSASTTWSRVMPSSACRSTRRPDPPDTVVPRRVRKTGDVARRYRARDPLARSRCARAGVPASPRPCVICRSRSRLSRGSGPSTGSPTPRNPRHATASSGVDPLAHLGERHRREIQHRLRGEQIELRHRLVRARDQRVDLVRFGRQGRVVARRASRASGTRVARRRCLERSAQAAPPRADPTRFRSRTADRRTRTRAAASPTASPAARVSRCWMRGSHAIGISRRRVARTRRRSSDTARAFVATAPSARRRRRVAERRHAARREQEAGARHAVVEPERVHPPFVDDVVHRRPVVGIRPFRQRRHDSLHQSARRRSG